MAVRKRKPETLRPSMPIAPMIDVVFLLLIYFMVGGSLKKQEADLRFQLPGRVEQAVAMPMPDEQRIRIRADGAVVLNNYRCDTPGSEALPRLVGILTRFRKESRDDHTEASVTLVPADSASQQRIVDVMDACAAAGIEQVSFAVEGDERDSW